METIVVREEHSPVQRALLHHWRAEGAYLVFVGLLLGIGLMFNLVPLALAVCLVLLAPLALTSLALRRRHYRLAADSSLLGGCVQGMMVVCLFPLLGGRLTLEDGAALLPILGLYLTLVAPLACTAIAALGCSQALEEGGAVTGQRRLPGQGMRALTASSADPCKPGAVPEEQLSSHRVMTTLARACPSAT